MKEKITIIDKNNRKTGYIYLYKEQFLEGTKEVLSLRGKDARVDLKFLENGGVYLFIENKILKNDANTAQNVKTILGG